MSPDPTSLALKIAPLAKPAIRALLGLDEVVTLFALLKSDIHHSSEIPWGKHKLVWRRMYLQAADPDIAWCLNAYLTGGDIAAAKVRLRERLTELLRFDEPDINDSRVVELVTTSIEANLADAARSDRAANRTEHALTRAAADAGLSEIRDQLGRLADDLRREYDVDQCDERAFLGWVTDQFAQIRTAGLGTARHLQLPLADVFVSPIALRESLGGARWQTRADQQIAELIERRRSGTISGEDYEAWLDRLSVHDGLRSPVDADTVSVAKIVRDAGQVIVLGDPGTGKTTFLRYLALVHAQALRAGASIVSADIGEARVPVYVRGGEFARWADRQQGLGLS